MCTQLKATKTKVSVSKDQQRKNKHAPEINTVTVATPSRAHTTNTDRPAGVLGAGSPYPIVVNETKPKYHVASKIGRFGGTNLKGLQKYIDKPYDHPSVRLNIAEPTYDVCQIAQYDIGSEVQAKITIKLTNQNTTNNDHAKDERIKRACFSVFATIESYFTFISSLLEVVASVVELSALYSSPTERSTPALEPRLLFKVESSLGFLTSPTLACSIGPSWSRETSIANLVRSAPMAPSRWCVSIRCAPRRTFIPYIECGTDKAGYVLAIFSYNEYHIKQRQKKHLPPSQQHCRCHHLSASALRKIVVGAVCQVERPPPSPPLSTQDV